MTALDVARYYLVGLFWCWGMTVWTFTMGARPQKWLELGAALAVVGGFLKQWRTES